MGLGSNITPWWLLGPCNFKRHRDPDYNPEGSDWEECTVCGRLTRFRVETMKKCQMEAREKR